jgi:hypothetical protein
MQISANTPWFAIKLKPDILNSFVVKNRDLILRNQIIKFYPSISEHPFSDAIFSPR